MPAVVVVAAEAQRVLRLYVRVAHIPQKAVSAVAVWQVAALGAKGRAGAVARRPSKPCRPDRNTGAAADAVVSPSVPRRLLPERPPTPKSAASAASPSAACVDA